MALPLLHDVADKGLGPTLPSPELEAVSAESLRSLVTAPRSRCDDCQTGEPGEPRSCISSRLLKAVIKFLVERCPNLVRRGGVAGIAFGLAASKSGDSLVLLVSLDPLVKRFGGS